MLAFIAGEVADWLGSWTANSKASGRFFTLQDSSGIGHASLPVDSTVYNTQSNGARGVLNRSSKENPKAPTDTLAQGVGSGPATGGGGLEKELSLIDITRDQIDDSPRDEVVEFSSAPVKKRGRPPRDGLKKKEKPERIGRVWEFIRDLLLDPRHNPDVICWEDRDKGRFRFVESDRVARLWGERKGNDAMDFKKFSRSIRHYYKNKIILPTKELLVYKFGPNATGWKEEPPVISQGQGH